MANIQKRLTKNGKKTYRVQVRIKGYPAQTATFEKRHDAKRWAQQTEAAIREGRHFKTSEAKKHTLNDLIERYSADFLPNYPNNAKDKRYQLAWWKQKIGKYLLADITPALISEYKDKLSQEITPKGTKKSPSTVVRYLAALSHVLSIAVKEYQWIEDNPVQKITKPKEPKGRSRYLSDIEREALLIECKKSKNSYLYLAVVIALSTGIRKSELMNLTWSNVDLKNCRIVLYKTKNGETRSVPLTHLALTMLKKHERNRPLTSTLVFPSKNNKKPLDLRSAWETAIKNANIEDFRWHDLRHSCASYLAMNGASLTEIAEILGHKSIQMSKKYAHLSESHTSTVLRSMNEKIFG